MSSSTTPTHLDYLTLALSEAHNCIGTPTAFCVGAILVDTTTPTHPTILSTGYSRELPGNTHAEQVCLTKLLQNPPPPPAAALPTSLSASPQRTYHLYTTMEPCSERLSGSLPCTDRIIAYNASAERAEKGLGKITTVYVGVKEPATFIKKNIGEEKLSAAGVEYIHIPGLEGEILQAANKGHES